MKQLNDKLDGLSELVTRIDAKAKEINDKLDELIKALHEYDNDGYGVEEWDEKRMDIIGQNGNEGLHYTSHHVSNEEADENAYNDYGKLIVEEIFVVDKDNNTQDNKRMGEKKNKRKYYKPKSKQ
jgi:hypothetical protein